MILSGEELLSGEERRLVIGREQARVAIVSGDRIGGFEVMSLLRESIELSSAKAALRRSMLTTSSLSFSKIVDV